MIMASFAAVILLHLVSNTYAGCSYYEANNISFPTNTCVNTTMVNGKITSSGYYCYNGLFRTSVYHYFFDGPHCKGSPIQTYINNCNAPTCNCAIGDSPSQCKLARVSYDTEYCPKKQYHQQFDEQNLTVIVDECINDKRYYIIGYDARLEYEQFWDDGASTCSYSKQSSQPTCFKYDYEESESSDTDTDTDTDIIRIYTTSQSQHEYIDEDASFRDEVKGILEMIAAGVILCTLCCACCCVFSRFRKKKQRNQVAEIDENLLGESDMNEEGIQSEFVAEIEDEKIIIPGQDDQEIEINEVVAKEDGDKADDIPSPAFCSDVQDEAEMSFEISEGNEGMMEEQQSSSEESSISNLSALDI